MKYDPRENGDNETFVPAVLKAFADRGIRPDRAILEPAWQNPQYNWDTKKFPDVPKLIKEMAPTKLILWEHPILDVNTAGCASIVKARGKRVCVHSDGWKVSCCPAPEHDGHKCVDCDSASANLYSQLVAADCIAQAPPQQHHAGKGMLGIPTPKQFSDLTLPKCQEIWKTYQLKHAIALKDQFVANISHELRTPLSGILGGVELLLEEVFESLAEKLTYCLRNFDGEVNKRTYMA